MPRVARDWSASEIELLGTASDQEIAQRIGASYATVARKREALGIAPHRASLSASQMTAGFRSLLGSMSDRELGARHGVHPSTVRNARLELGIPAYVEPAATGWSEADDAVVLDPGRSRAEKCEMLGRKPSELAARRQKLLKRAKAWAWSDALALSQPDFFREALCVSGLTRRELAEKSFVSFSRLEKWAAPGGGQEPMAIYMRRLIFLTATLGHILDKEDE